jgi:CheY-like chemotaxis protein
MKSLHILLAEDNRGDVMLVERALAEHHIEHELHVVKDGGQAIAYVSCMGTPGHPPCPDVILLDLNLPIADGPQVLGEFRRHPECAKTPVIVVTSSDAARDRAKVAELGISHYFRKPSSLAGFMKLGAVVRDVVAGAGTA